MGQGGSSAGHLGVQSIIESLGTNDFPRIRVGVGRPPEGMDPAKYVLLEMKGSDLDELLAVDRAHAEVEGAAAEVVDPVEAQQGGVAHRHQLVGGGGESLRAA